MTDLIEESSTPEYKIAPEYINAHALGKFEFCERAGLIAFESQQSDDSDDWQRTPRLDYVPIFDIARLNEKLEESTHQLTQSGIFILGVLVVVAIVSWLISKTLGIFLSFAIVVLGRKAFLHFLDSREFSRFIKQYKAADVAQLVEPRAGVKRIDWWGLLKSDEFSSNKPEARFVSESLGLCGKPTQLATYRGRRIPVIVHFGELEKPKPYHLVRLAAYGLLIDENVGGAPVEWGIILNPTTMKGLAVPISPDSKSAIKKKVSSFRSLIQDSQSGSEPIAPPSSYCEECPYGRPRVHVKDVTETQRNGKKLPVYDKRANRGKRYHSPCGDRFQWVPPHELAVELGIREGEK